MSQPKFEFFWTTFPITLLGGEVRLKTIGPYVKMSVLRGQLTQYNMKGDPAVKFYRTTGFEEFDPNG